MRRREFIGALGGGGGGVAARCARANLSDAAGAHCRWICRGPSDRHHRAFGRPMVVGERLE